MDEQSPPLLLDLGSFKALSVLGRGAKGVALLITKSNNGKTQTPIALKAISKSLIEKKKKEEDDPYKRIWFERYVLELFDHPLFPKLRGLVITNDIIGFAIDYCPGGHLNSLRTHQTERMFSDDIIRFYAAELVLALEYLHNLGVIYRDLKPENILIQETGHLMIVDFDLSTKLSPQTSPSTKLKNSSTKFLNRRRRLLWSWWLCNSNTGGGGAVVVDSAPSDSVPPKSNSFVGTIEYVAPEIILGNGHDFSVDWWSLGVTLYEMLYGYTPFRGIDRKETFYRILTKSPELVGERTPLRDLIGKLLQKDSANRISVEEIKSHDFFKAVKWDHVLNISRPPFIPLPTHVTWEDEEDLEGIRGIDVELLVQQVVGGDDNVQKEKDDTDVRQIGKSKNNKNDENVGIKNGRNPWVDGLNNNPCKSSDFLVF